MKNTGFIRDLLVKLLLLVIFVFLLMKLFPMPNLTPFYDKIFNENIQTMKDAAKDYYTTERMPQTEGKSSKMTLQDMIDNNLIIPFVDKNGESCDTNKSYVKVTKKGNEYELKVSLTCGKESHYIIDKIGCYNFCASGACEVKTETDEDGNIVVVNPNGRYETEYEFVKNITKETWQLGDWTTEKLPDTEDRKLVDTKTQYTGQKKVTTGTKLYEEVKYGYKTEYSYDINWRNEKVTEEDAELWKERTLYTGQKKIETGQTLYEHVKYGQVDNWTYDTDWTTEVKQTSDNLRLWKERTLYTGQKKIETTTTNYKHVKYGTTENWTETGWTTANRQETNDIKVVGKRFTVTKDIYENVCTNFVTDDTWYSSKPADTSARIYDPTPVASNTTSDWTLLYNSYKSYTSMGTYVGDRKYEFLYSEETVCTSNCNGQSKVRVYYYRVYQRSAGTTTYKYRYCVPTTRFVKTDTQVVTDLQSYLNKGYTLVKTEYNYKVRSTVSGVIDTKWTESTTPPEGYTYTGKSSKVVKVTYEQLNKWVGSKEALGEYTYNIQTVKQYKYGYNNPTRYIEDYKWTTSKTSPSGYEFTGKTETSKSTTYEQLDHWVTSKEALGEYTYNITTVKQYKYRFKKTIRYIEDTKWITVNKADEGYVLTGNEKETSKTTYIDLGRWVDKKSDLGEYTYNIKTRTLYRYKTRTSTTTQDYIWAKTNPGNGYEPTGRSRSRYIPNSGNVQK